MITQNLNPLIHTQSLHLDSLDQRSYTWTKSQLEPFDELLISWNALRPLIGHYVILCRLLIEDQWSSWLLHAVWGSQEQFSFHDAPQLAPFHSFQDQVELLNGKVATGYSIRVEACRGATLENFYHLYASTSHLKSSPPSWSPSLRSYSALPVPKISQFCLMHPRARSFCSPTSTTAVVQYLLSYQKVDPLQFARQVYDAGFDIYGHWSFNIAQAFVELGPQWQCFYTRMKQIEWLWLSLEHGFPVVISVKGHLPGTILPYSSGHLIVIKGYNAATQQFLCMDPAFPSNDQTETAYPWQALMQAWEKRHYLTYFFFPKDFFCKAAHK